VLKCFADQRRTAEPGPWELPCDHSYSLYDKKLIFELRWNVFLLQHNLFFQGKAKGRKNWQQCVAISAQDKNSWEQRRIRSTVTAVQIPPGLNKMG